ncbi:MAG: hypothetical protein JW918_05875, partial [Anaerolineae bacterium]|nr:hypothetical protein [Anaerolineae bacterium]
PNQRLKCSHPPHRYSPPRRLQSTTFDNISEQEDSSKGMRVNSRWLGTKDYPAWATPLQREKWTKRGLILWNSEARRVTQLSATQAIHVLDYLRTNDDWQTRGITVGEPATRLVIGDPDREPEQVLLDEISLTATQSQELLVLLQSNQEALRELSKWEEEERGRALHEAYCILFGRENWELLCRLYQHDPEKAMEIIQEITSSKTTAKTAEEC